MRKFRRILSWLILFCAVLSIPAFATDGTAGDLNRFVSGTPIAFTDVPRRAWYYGNVREMSALGLMSGVGGNRFLPEKPMEVAEAVSLAARVHAIYTTGSLTELNALPSKGGWFVRYYTYLENLGLLDESWRQRPEAPAPREFLALLFADIIHPEHLAEINLIDTLPDCSPESARRILPLYRAGVLVGNDAFGTFEPDTPLTRGAAAAICSRLIRPALRQKQYFVPFDDGKYYDFTDVTEYDGRFADVSRKAWYYKSVILCFERGLMIGETAHSFSPNGHVTLSEVAVAAARFHCRRLTGSTELLDAFPKGKTWYSRYYRYLSAAGLLAAEYTADPDASATRGQAVGMFARMVQGSLPTLNRVNALPDYAGEEADAILHLYNAGVICGKDSYGTFGPEDKVLRCELAGVLARLAEPSLRRRFTLKIAAQVFTYGTSGAGRMLTGYKLGNGPKALVLTFAIHGWEDNWARDGQTLVNTAHALVRALETKLKKDPTALGGWTVYVLPSCNPDGLAEGTSCDGPGRRTVWSYDASGKLIRKGIDLNRSFPSGFKVYTDDRNFNGSAPLAAPEAKALDGFLRQVADKHATRYFVDVHGWYNQIIADESETLLRSAFWSQFPSLAPEKLGGRGYLFVYAARSLGYHAALFEFPHVSSPGEFAARGYEQKFINAIEYILKR